jgi:hypothetical protein
VRAMTTRGAGAREVWCAAADVAGKIDFKMSIAARSPLGCAPSTPLLSYSSRWPGPCRAAPPLPPWPG